MGVGVWSFGLWLQVQREVPQDSQQKPLPGSMNAQNESSLSCISLTRNQGGGKRGAKCERVTWEGLDRRRFSEKTVCDGRWTPQSHTTRSALIKLAHVW